jgi:hypothetical protein
MKEAKATSDKKSKKSTKEELPRCQKVRCWTGCVDERGSRGLAPVFPDSVCGRQDVNLAPTELQTPVPA